MASVMRFTGLATTTLHILKVTETTAIQTVERFQNALIESLVECYHY
jgi:hypothetical protein